MSDALVQFLLRQGDNALVLGHRLSEWCGHAPALEEDIALANVALDLIGQAQLWLGLAGEIEGKGRSPDDLAFQRDVWDFRNLLLVEQPNRDYAHTMIRQVLFDAFQVTYLGALSGSRHTQIAEIATKAVKEANYHLDRSREMVIALGDGTDESHKKMQESLDAMWVYSGEMFAKDLVDHDLDQDEIVPDLDRIKEDWTAKILDLMNDATLTIPKSEFFHKGGKNGHQHTEHLGHMLATMQFLPRAYPNAKW